MTRFQLVSTAAAVLFSASVCAHAQMPTDNASWKARCSVLAAQAADLNHVSPSVVALTRGVAGSKFQTFGFDRQAAGQHNVACTMFYLAAVANHAGNGGKADGSAAQDAQLLAKLEVKAMAGQEPTFVENLSRTKIKAFEITRPALTVVDEENVLTAATTIPFTQSTASLKPVAMLNGGSARLKH